MQNDKPSMSAYRIALSIVTLGAKPGMDRLLPPGTAQATEKLLVASGIAGEETIRWCRSQPMVCICESFDWIVPGQLEAFAHRKAFCERQVRDGIRAGATQILILGAGYDTVAWRLAPEFPDVNFFEVDLPATSRLKAKGIKVLGRRENLVLIAEDLDKRKLVETLETNKAWDQSIRSVVVAEGLLMYLSSESVQNLFAQCADATGTGSRIVYTYIPSGAGGWPDLGLWTGLLLLNQMLIGEPWIWSIQPEKLGLFLEQAGWTNDPALTAETRRHGVEFFAVATQKDRDS